MEATCSSTEEWIQKIMVYIYNKILLGHTKEQNVPFVETWVDLQPVLHSEECQKEKNKYCLLTLTCGI